MIKLINLSVFFLLFSLSLAQSEFNINLYSQNKALSPTLVDSLLPIENEFLLYELLAKSGRVINDTLLIKHFAKQIWYNPNSTINKPLSNIDSVNFELLLASLRHYKQSIKSNIERYEIDTSQCYRVYYTRVRENSSIKTKVKKTFSLFPFSYCKTMQIFQPVFFDDVPPEDFEQFLIKENFKIENYNKFIIANAIKGDLFRVYYNKSNRIPVLIEEMGLEPNFNLGKTYAQYYLNDRGFVTLTKSNICVEKDISGLAIFNFYDKTNSLIKEIMLIEKDTHIFIQFSNNLFYFETAMPKKLK